MFYAVTIAQIVKYIPKKKFKLITIAVLACFILFDMFGGNKKLWNGGYCTEVLKDDIDGIRGKLTQAEAVLLATALPNK